LSDDLKHVMSNVEDIILIGSSVLGKDKPADTDLIIVFNEKVDEKILSKVKDAVPNAHIIPKTRKALFAESFQAREGVLFHGISLKTGKQVAESYGGVGGMIISYSLEGKSKSDRMRFYYSLHGRKKEEGGMYDELKLKKLADGVFYCLPEYYYPLTEYLDQWEIPYKEIPVLFPARILKMIK